MNGQKKAQIKTLLWGIPVGILLGSQLVLHTSFFSADLNNASENQQMSGGDKAEPEILYWVAPMDANFRRDKAGKSPMGMDLVPVYKKSSNAGDEEYGPGVVRIQPDIENNLSVRTARVKRDFLNHSLKASGVLTMDPAKTENLHSRVAGWLVDVYVHAAGERIDKGQALYSIYSPELVDAKEDYIRAIKHSDKPQKRAALTRLSRLGLGAKNIAELNRNFEKPVDKNTVFYADGNGFIDALNIKAGDYIVPATRLITLVDYRQLWLMVEVPASQTIYLDTAADTQSYVAESADIAGKIWHARLDYIYPTLNKALRTQTIRFILDNSNYALHAGMWMNLNAEVSSVDKQLLVERSAIIRTGSGDRAVLKIAEGRYKSVAVQVGHSDADYFSIQAGLKAGDEVVTSAQFLIDSESMIDSDLKRYDASSAMNQQGE